jgi:hypothetical protein
MSPPPTHTSLPSTSELVEGVLFYPIALVVSATIFPGLTLCIPGLILAAALILIPIVALALVLAVVAAVVAAPVLLVRATVYALSDRGRTRFGRRIGGRPKLRLTRTRTGPALLNVAPRAAGNAAPSARRP